jgi:hypothetical protein
VYKAAYYRKQTKNQWARDDPVRRRHPSCSMASLRYTHGRAPTSGIARSRAPAFDGSQAFAVLQAAFLMAATVAHGVAFGVSGLVRDAPLAARLLRPLWARAPRTWHVSRANCWRLPHVARLLQR